MSWIERRALLQKIEKSRDSRALLYVTGDRPKLETKIHSEVLDLFVDHLDNCGVTKRISLILYTRGGDGIAAWSLFNLVRMYCDELEVIVPMRAHSAGTMIAIGADRIIMTKQSSLSPIDPSLNHPLAPRNPGNSSSRIPVSVEAIAGYLDLARDTLGAETSEPAMEQTMLDLARQVHPLVLGETYRRRQQTQLLAEKLLKPQVPNADDRNRIISFLSSDSGSHDYTLNRREAAALGLPVVKCPARLYPLIRQLYCDFRDEMCLRVPFDAFQFPPNATTPFTNVRAIIESTAANPMHYMSAGNYVRQPGSTPDKEETWVQTLTEGWVARD